MYRTGIEKDAPSNEEASHLKRINHGALSAHQPPTHATLFPFESKSAKFSDLSIRSVSGMSRM